MRGKLGHPWKASELKRITPAHAGKTITRRSTGQKILGSPPRMRGKPYRRCSRVDEARITPAHAGKTGCPDTAAQVRQDHPRACGENVLVEGYVKVFIGSPPRMRGKRSPRGCGGVQRRITPAHAGKTSAWKTLRICVKDHPRACGENFSSRQQVRRL